MPFTVEDFQDLLVLLQRHPERRVQLWATLAGEELLRLPGEFRAFRGETGRSLGALTEAQWRTEECRATGRPTAPHSAVPSKVASATARG